MRVVSQRTGLSPHVLRVWERRYEAVVPERTETNRRLYTEREILRLSYLARLTEEGQGISQLASLSTETLAEMVAEGTEASPTARDLSLHDTLLEEAWACVTKLDSVGLYDVLDRAGLALGVSGFSMNVVVPLVDRIGASWGTGEISAAEEHAASVAIREALFAISRPFAESSDAPNLVVTTPQGQLHELGAALVSAIARRDGWNVIYLGPSLPAMEIARVAEVREAKAVALSIVYPGDDQNLHDELNHLHRLVPDGTEILVGGRSASAYASTLAELGLKPIESLAELKVRLDELRAREG